MSIKEHCKNEKGGEGGTGPLFSIQSSLEWKYLHFAAFYRAHLVNNSETSSFKGTQVEKKFEILPLVFSHEKHSP